VAADRALGHRDKVSLVFACGFLRALNGGCENNKQWLSEATIRGPAMVYSGKGMGTTHAV
jgi:hypothetical protein